MISSSQYENGVQGQHTNVGTAIDDAGTVECGWHRGCPGRGANLLRIAGPCRENRIDLDQLLMGRNQPGRCSPSRLPVRAALRWSWKNANRLSDGSEVLPWMLDKCPCGSRSMSNGGVPEALQGSPQIKGAVVVCPAAF